MRKLLLVLLGMLCGPSILAPAAEFTVPEGAQYLELRGVVGRNGIDLAETISKMSAASSDPIYMLINSPGGAVLPGLQLVSAMRLAQKRGVEFYCVVPMLAASMASIVYDECDHRYALGQALLLWHSIAEGVMFANIHVEDAQAMAFGMERLQQDIPQQLQKHLGFSDQDWRMLYNHELFITAGEVHARNPKYLTPVDDIPGLPGLFSMQAQRPASGDDDKTNKTAPNKKQEIVPIPDSYEWIPSSLREKLLDAEDEAAVDEAVRNFISNRK